MCDYDNSFDGPDWLDIALAGALAEEIAEAERERLKAQKEIEQEQDEGEVDQTDR